MKSLFRLLFILIILVAQDVYADDEDSGADVYIKSGGLCVGGAIVGTVVPVIGNIVGCAVGAVAGYFWGSSESKPEKIKEPIASVVE
ncbi:MAG TPA: hypothetical protein ENK06_05080 [Gammaproteobacteria bacterium]|nr:hypothetical protein [Gammaproteobacteria bacterium]